ncbi:hypothetical protein PXH66_20135 [Synoicihabitans lomoniglobus]|uniref:DUF7305 domain-containing protein n=2 Tax=Synoicihabitans lomoniglobus TaxID=2909285 RepID=A0AAE9ZWU6_9BACT|nr:hypothetical protein PXH66_20135 [Opitutaceae bacterium LMO-M01]
MRSERGSALLVALIIAAVLLTATARLYNTAYTEQRSAYRSYMRSAAFYLAEAGMEDAAQRIENGEFNVDPDAENAEELLTNYHREEDIFLGGGRTGEKHVIIRRDVGTNFYTVQALGRVRHPDGLTTEQAVQAGFELIGGLGEESTSSGGGPGYSISAGNNVRFGFNGGNNRVRVASYDSNLNFGVPDWDTNSGFDAAVGVASSQDNRMDLGNALIKGTLRTGGGNPRITTNSHDERGNTQLYGPDTEDGVTFDTNRVAKDFAEDMPVPTLPELDGTWNQIEVDQNDNSYRNQRVVALGAVGEKTYIHLPYAFDTKNNSTITVAGDVILNLDRNMNLNGRLELLPGATLTIFVVENASVSLEGGDWPPADFRINATGGRDVQFNNFDVFTGIVNAPNSTVRVSGSGGLGRTQFRGAITANQLETTNSIDFFYDVQTDGGSSSSVADPEGAGEVLELRMEGWKQILPSDMGGLVDSLDPIIDTVL